MRALILVPNFYGLGGAQRYARQFTQATIASLGPSSVGVWSYLAGDPGVDIGGSSSYLGEAVQASSPLGKIRFATRALRLAGGTQLIVACHINVAPVAYLCARRYGVPYVIIGYGIDVWGRLPGLRRLALRHAAKVVALSHFTAGRLRSDSGLPDDRVTVIEPVVDADLMRQAMHVSSRQHEEAKVLLTVARLAAAERYKGCDTVIRVLPKVREAAGPIRYVIAGDGDDRPRLEDLARQVGVSDVVRFVGRAEGEALARLYAECDVFVMPARSGFWDGAWRGEGFGIVFIEAAAFGKPSVAGAGDGSQEAVLHEQTGLVVNSDQDSSVAEAIARLLQDDGVRGRMGRAARRRVEEYFVLSRMERQVHAVLSDLLPGRG